MSTQKHKSVLKHANPMATTFEPSKNSSVTPELSSFSSFILISQIISIHEWLSLHQIPL